MRWITEAGSRREEMLASLRLEGVEAEAIFLQRGRAGDALVFYLRARDLAEAQRAFAQSELPIARETRAIIAECWDTSAAEPLQVLLELVGPAV